MIEAHTVGGTCVNIGCVPSKFVLRAAELQHECRSGAFDLPAVIERKDDLVGALRHTKYEELIERYDFEFRKGTGRFADPQTLLIDSVPVQAGKYLIATGSVPKVPSIPGLFEAGFLTSTPALDLRTTPETIAVIGGNSIGLELGQYFARIGSRVVILEALERIAPFEERELSDALATALMNEGIEIRAGVRIDSVSVDKRKQIHFNTPDGASAVLEVDEILVATGRKPNTEHLALEAAGVRTTSGGAVIVDEYLRTSNPRIYAAGDVTGAPQFVYVAGYEGALAADNAIDGSPRPVNLNDVPRVIFTSPQVAAVGMTEREATERRVDVKVALLPLGQSVPRAMVNGTDGIVKIVADRTNGRILGVHVVSDSASEVIQAATLAVKFNLTVRDLVDTFHPYLTMAESLKLAAQSFDRDVASLSCCAT